MSRVSLFQPKQLRKLIQQTFQGYSTLKQDQCMERFFSTLAHCYSFTQEKFACQLMVSVYCCYSSMSVDVH